MPVLDVNKPLDDVTSVLDKEVVPNSDLKTVDPSKHKNVYHLFNQQVQRTPFSVAIRFGDQAFSYSEVNLWVNQVAALLVAGGIEAGDIVAISMDRSEKMVIAMLAVLKAGAAFLPLDPGFPQDRLDFMLDDADAKMLLTSHKYEDRYKTKAKVTAIEDVWLNLSTYQDAEVHVEVKGDDLAYILYTSGSTGKPKGVQVAQGNLVNFLTSMQQKLSVSEADKLLAITTISFDISLMELLLPLISGASVIVLESTSARDGLRLLDILKEKQPTIMQATPATWQMLLDAGWNSSDKIKIICSGGEALKRTLAEQLVLRSDLLFNLYGPTETTIWSTYKRITPEDELITIGHPIDNTQIYILNEALQPVAENEAGEIYIAGDGVACGYLNRPELTQERFIPCLGDTNKKMYRTGDLGKWLPNGEIQCLGRIDNQVKIRGYRIELEEIEYRLVQQDGIRQAVVNPYEDHLGELRLVAYIVMEEGNADHWEQYVDQWKMNLKQKLPAYMVPEQFLALPAIPLTPNGKTDRKALPKPAKSLKAAGIPIKEPVTTMQVLIADIWKDILGLEKVSVDASFFDLGGHSLIAVQLIKRIEKATGIRLPIAVLFEHPTVAGLAALLNVKDRTAIWDCIVPIKPSGNKVPLYIIHGVSGSVPFFNGNVDAIHPEQPIFGIQAKGLDGSKGLPETIEEQAAQYVEEILKHNSGGPVVLAGYSYGGFIAFEMAKQLKAMNKEVKMLCLFDTYSGFPKAQGNLFKRIGARLHKSSMQFVYGLTFLVQNPKSSLQYRKSMLKWRLRGTYMFFKYKLGGRKPDYFYYKYQIQKTNSKAFRKYMLTPYDGKVDLYRANVRTHYIHDMKYLGWGSFALKGVQVHDIPGEHNNIFMAPYAKEFARVLQDSLNGLEDGKNRWK